MEDTPFVRVSCCQTANICKLFMFCSYMKLYKYCNNTIIHLQWLEVPIASHMTRAVTMTFWRIIININPNSVDNKGSLRFLKDFYCSVTMLRELGLKGEDINFTDDILNKCGKFSAFIAPKSNFYSSLLSCITNMTPEHIKPSVNFVNL